MDVKTLRHLYPVWEWEVYLEGSHANKVWRFYHEQTKDPILAYALSVKDVKDGKVTGTIYPLDYGTHVERVKSLTCPIEKVAVAFEDGTNFTLPYQERRRLMNELIRLAWESKVNDGFTGKRNGAYKHILRREHVQTFLPCNESGDIQEYIDSLKKSTLRGRLKEVQTAAAFTRKPPSRKRRRNDEGRA